MSFDFRSRGAICNGEVAMAGSEIYHQANAEYAMRSHHGVVRGHDTSGLCCRNDDGGLE